MSAEEQQTDAAVNTPQGGRRPTRDEKNTRSFRVANNTTPKPRTPQRAGDSASPTSAGHTQHQLLARFKAVIADALGYVQGHPQDDSVADHFIAISEDAVRSFKAAKVDARTQRRAKPAGTYADPNASIDSAGAPEVEEKPKPRSYAAALAARKASPPDARDTVPARQKPVTPEAISEDRTREAIRGEEKRDAAEGRRKLLAMERQQKAGQHTDRIAEAKARREAVTEQLKTDSAKRVEKAAKSRDEEMDRRREFAQKDAARVDESTFIASSQQEAMASALDERSRKADKNAEQLAQQRAQAARERADAHETVVHRARSNERAKREEREQRAAAKEEQLRRLEEQRQKDLESRAQRSEERERKLAEHANKTQAEQEAKQRKSAERNEQAEKLREEREKAQREKLEKQEAKLREVRERRDRDEERPPIASALPARSDADVAAAMQKFARCAVLAAKHAKPYLESTSHIPAEAAKSKLRPLLGRIAANTSSVALCRQPLSDLIAALDTCTPADFAALRWQGGLPVIADVLSECRRGKSTDTATLRVVFDLISRLLSHPTERTANLDYFTRSGCVMHLLAVIQEDMASVKRPLPWTFTSVLTALLTVSRYVLHEAGDRPEMQVHRLMLFDAFDSLDLYGFILTYVGQAEADDMPGVQLMLAVLQCIFSAKQQHQLSAMAQRDLCARLCHALFSCVANVLMKGGQYLKSDAAITPTASAVLFAALRTLNDVTRKSLRHTQALLADAATSTEFYHVVSSVCTYVVSHEDELEAIPPSTLAAEDYGKSPSFRDAADAGITFDQIPVPDPLTRKQSQQWFLRAAFHELVLFTGYVAVNNTGVQDLFCYGTSGPLLSQLVAALQVSYFGVSMHVVFPSLLAICYQHPRNLVILANDMDRDSLVAFLTAEVEALNVAAPKESPVTPPAATVSWADMADDDDGAGFPSTPSTVTAEQAQHMERAIGSAVAKHPYAVFFRMDKRFAPELWHTALSALTM